MRLITNTIWKNHKKTLLAIVFVFLYSASVTLAVPPTTKYQPGETLNPNCAPGENNCSVQILPEQAGNADKYLTTDGNQTAWSANTLILGGNFGTTGGAITLNASGVTNLTLPTSGTLVNSATTQGMIDTSVNTAVSGTANYIPKFSGSNSISNSLIYDTGTNVGIGTATPSYALDVAGDSVRINGASSSYLRVDRNTSSDDAGILLSTSNIPNWAIGTLGGTVGSGTDLSVYGTGGTPGIRLTILSATGNVGVGTTTPNSRLEVNGDIRMTAGSGAQLVFADGSTMSSAGAGSAASVAANGDAIVTGDGDANNSGDVILKTASNDRLHILNNGNVGVGTATPSALFSVGSGSPFTVTSLGAVSSGTWNGSVVAGQYGGTGVANTGKTITLGGNLTTSGAFATTLTATGTTTLTLPTTGTLATVANISSAVSGTANYVPKFTGANAVGNSLVYDDGTNVGIGTASPSAKLEVNGNIHLSSNTNYLLFGTNVLANPYIQGDASNNFYVGTSNAARITVLSGGNVGIGTTSPQTIFHINSSSNPQFKLTNTTTGTAAGDGFRILMGDDLNVTVTNREAGYMSFETSDTERMRILSGGNVGIGTTSPGYKLHVLGSATGGPGIYVEGGASQYAMVGIKGGNGGQEWQLQSLNGTSSDFYISKGQGDPKLVIMNNGDIGISTTAPNFTAGNRRVLDINGPATALLSFSAAGAAKGFVYNDGTNMFLTSTTGSVLMQANNTTVLTIDPAQNVYFNYSPQSSYYSVGGYRQITAGGFGVLYRNDYDMYVMSNSQLNSGGTYMAKYSTVEGMGQMAYLGGRFEWNVVNGSVTGGTNYSMTTAFKVSKAGDVYASSLGTGALYSNGGTLTNSNPSDRRLKNSIHDLSYGLEQIRQLQPKTYYYNDDEQHERLQYGFLAQDVQSIMPELVRPLNDGTDHLGLEINGIYVATVKAIQEMDLNVTDIEDMERENSWRDSLLSWFANAENHITRIFTGEICLTDPDGSYECVNKQELRQLKQLLNTGPTGDDDDDTPPEDEEIPPPEGDVSDGEEVVPPAEEPETPPEETPEPENPPTEPTP